MYAIVQSGAIDVAEIEERVVASHRGAVVSFIGLVRDHHQGRSVHALEYDAYGPMAVKTLRDIVAEAESRWQVEAAVVHRVGLLQIGEAAVVIATASAHRSEAFAACQYIIDALKARVPIWKREHYTEGQPQWVSNAESPQGVEP